jgi:hypothetical protein
VYVGASEGSRISVNFEVIVLRCPYVVTRCKVLRESDSAKRNPFDVYVVLGNEDPDKTPNVSTNVCYETFVESLSASLKGLPEARDLDCSNRV